MKKSFAYKRCLGPLLSLLIMTACSGQNTSEFTKKSVAQAAAYSTKAMSTFGLDYLLGRSNSAFCSVNSLQISEHVRRIFQDSKGNLWFGTNDYGVCRYDGRSFTYFSVKEGLGGTQVTGIIEDRKGNLWFTTNGGVSKYNGCSFTNYTEQNGLNHKWAWSILEDRQGTIWVGTLKGLCRYNGTRFTSIALPSPDVNNPTVDLSKNLIGCITEDQKGNLWFGVDNQGVCKYDGKTFQYITKEDGLCDNNIVTVLEDSNGGMWFGSMHGGLSHYNGESFINIIESNDTGDNEAWNIYEDKRGNVWFSSEGSGIYCFNKERKCFTNFSKSRGVTQQAVQTIFEDTEGRFWVGGKDGLCRYNRKSFLNLTREETLR
ncbi:hypothetical protein BKI52_33210 [marine bacterium AO1-C]|nr:hypothetical protein BKI52_33210 [marine bacterium AO1-C]